MSEQPQSQQMSPPDDGTAPPRNCLLTALVLAVTSCICLATITLSGFGGYQDEIKDIRTEQAHTRVAEVATQYALAVEDEAGGALEIAFDRYEYIQTQQPDFLDVNERHAGLVLLLSQTPTPAATDTPPATTPPTMTPESSIAPTDAAPATTPTSEAPAVAEYFDDAQVYYEVGLYEDAIEYFDIVKSLDPTYRQDEVNRMLLDALKTQAFFYLRGRNLDDDPSYGYPGDQLARGVQLADRAIDLYAESPSGGSLDPLPYEADFVRRYVTARGYLAGGLYGQAADILNRLCEENCIWGYRGVTVQDLLNQLN